MIPTAIHPGEHLAEELKELGMSAAELARKLDVPTNRVTGILNGQRAITGDTALRALNRKYRHKDKATDVLSFPAAETAEGVAGDLVISLETALLQARERGHTLEMEIKVLLLHGLLHLAGYDHEADNGTMHRKEARLRRELGLNSGLIERAYGKPSRQVVRA